MASSEFSHLISWAGLAFGTGDRYGPYLRYFFNSCRLLRTACEFRQNGWPRRGSRHSPCGDKKVWPRHCRRTNLRTLFWTRKMKRYLLRDHELRYARTFLQEIQLYMSGLESATKAAKTIVLFLTQRSGKAKATKNSNEAEYRTIFDNLVSDLLVVLFWPEWPAASLLLGIICKFMVGIMSSVTPGYLCMHRTGLLSRRR